MLSTVIATATLAMRFPIAAAVLLNLAVIALLVIERRRRQANV
jgi:hypothetical protein